MVPNKHSSELQLVLKAVTWFSVWKEGIHPCTHFNRYLAAKRCLCIFRQQKKVSTIINNNFIVKKIIKWQQGPWQTKTHPWTLSIMCGLVQKEQLSVNFARSCFIESRSRAWISQGIPKGNFLFASVQFVAEIPGVLQAQENKWDLFCLTLILYGKGTVQDPMWQRYSARSLESLFNWGWTTGQREGSVTLNKSKFDILFWKQNLMRPGGFPTRKYNASPLHQDQF